MRAEFGIFTMTMMRSRAAAAVAVLAAFSMTAGPALARGHGGWHQGRHHHHHRGGGGIDGGDVLAGLLIVGGIAAIATAASRSDRDRPRNAPYPGGPDDDPRDGGYGRHVEAPPRTGGSFDMAADACADELERGDRRVGSIEEVRRMGGRYSVEGMLDDGRGYACSVDESGQIRSVAVDGRALI